jgi:mannose-6-phosphate isomerase-like protein (cupin superfamily)
MKHCLVVLLLFVAIATQAQQVINLDQVTRRQDSLIINQHVAEFEIPSDDKIDAVLFVIKSEWEKHYNMLHSEYLHVLSGKGVVEFETGMHKIYPGAIIFIPQNTRFTMRTSGKKPIKLLAYRSPAPKQKDDVIIVE